MPSEKYIIHVHPVSQKFPQRRVSTVLPNATSCNYSSADSIIFRLSKQMARPPVSEIFICKVRVDVDASDRTQELYEQCKIVCTES